MKISGWLIVAVVVIWFLFFYKRKKATPGESAAENTPLNNLAASIAGSNKAADLVARVIDASQKYTNDLYDNAAIVQTQVKGGDFINVIPETDKIFAKTGAGKKKRDQAWWPKVMYEESPAWAELFTEDGLRIESCSCGCGELTLIKRS